MNKLRYIESFLPEEITSFLGNSAEEIRIRINEPAVVIYSDREVVTDTVFKREDIDSLIDRVTKSSLYTFSRDIANGFITVAGGHRIGLCGNCVYENGEVKSIKDISYMNIRIAQELKGVGEGLYARLFKDKVPSAVIISPPGGGKTTLIRDLTRLISDNTERLRVSLIDERNEISASFMGEPQNDVGKRTDVFVGYSKSDGIIRAVRSMSPNVIVLDEIGGADDEKAMLKCKHSGVSVIATMHGEDISDIVTSYRIFDYFIFIDKISRKTVIKTAGEIYDKNYRDCNNICSFKAYI